jgi:hypothetical protein
VAAAVKTYCLLSIVLALLSGAAIAQPPLDVKIPRFELQDGTVVEGASKLSSLTIPGVHLGLEEVLDSDQGPAVAVKFSVILEDATVRDVLNALCKYDSRYAWSVDGQTVNIYPRDTDPNFLTNLRVDQIKFENVKDAYEALERLVRVLPKQQLGYAGVGFSPAYREPWTASFNGLTVRQYVNRIAEHVEPNGGWVLSGSSSNRFFFFYPKSFR